MQTVSKEQVAHEYFLANPNGVHIVYVCDCGHIAKYYKRTNGANCPKCNSDKLLSRSNRVEAV